MNLPFNKRHKLHKDAGHETHHYEGYYICDEFGNKVDAFEEEDEFQRLSEKFRYRFLLIKRLNEAHTLTFDFGEDNTILINGKTVDNRYWDLPKSEQDVEVYYKAITEEFVSNRTPDINHMRKMDLEDGTVIIAVRAELRSIGKAKPYGDNHETVHTCSIQWTNAQGETRQTNAFAYGSTVEKIAEGDVLVATPVVIDGKIRMKLTHWKWVDKIENPPHEANEPDSDKRPLTIPNDNVGSSLDNYPENEEWQLYQQMFNEPIEGDSLSQSWSEDYHPNEEDWDEFEVAGQSNGAPPSSRFGKETENNDTSSDGVYITNANLRAHILRTTDLMKVEIDGPVYKSFIGFFNKLERNELLAVRELFKDPKRFFSSVYKPYIPKDTYTLVYEGIKPAYHSSIKCSALNADYRNYEVPQKIRNQGIQEVKKFRTWFMPRASLLQKKPDKFEKEFFEKWGFEANLKTLFSSNKGPFLLKNFKTFEEREIYIEGLLQEAKSFAEKSDKHRAILSHFEKDSWQGIKGELRKRNKTGYTDAEVLEVLKEFELEHKRPIKFQLIEYYKHRYNPNLEFAKNDLEALGFAPCGQCALNDAFGDLGVEILEA